MSNKFKTSAMFLLVASAMGLASCSGQPEGAVKEDAIILRFSHFGPLQPRYIRMCLSHGPDKSKTNQLVGSRLRFILQQP